MGNSWGTVDRAVATNPQGPRSNPVNGHFIEHLFSVNVKENLKEKKEKMQRIAQLLFINKLVKIDLVNLIFF